ncbi:hypothetical protein AB0I54_07800 [Streptomyces sp. NPDC050625]|uniref:hypothetical protein n=1 Tax=Streptomyces sp. NPDC050625 TaxID=3154629 RepID=UPI00343A573A
MPLFSASALLAAAAAVGSASSVPGASARADRAALDAALGSVSAVFAVPAAPAVAVGTTSVVPSSGSLTAVPSAEPLGSTAVLPDWRVLVC